MGIKIIGNGHCAPVETLSNQELEQIIQTSDDWIVTRTGIKSRHISSGEDTVELATLAGKKALEKSNVLPQDIDLVIVATFTPQYLTPSTACLVASNLGIDQSQVIAFDLNAACTGFVYALTVAAQFIENNSSQKALVIGVDVVSKIIDWTDRNTCILFGDGAGAVVVSHDEKRFVSYLNAKGDQSQALTTTALPLNTPKHKQAVEPIVFQMKGHDVFKFAVTAMKDTLHQLLNQSGLDISEIDLIIPHQANKRIIDKIQKDFKLDNQKFYLNLDRYGNTSAASIPIALSEAIEADIVTKNQQLLLVGFGGGLTWGGCLISMSC